MPRPAVLTWCLPALAAALCALAIGPAHAQAPSPPATGPETVQEIALLPGSNLVSLRVAPDDPSLAAIFAGALDGVVLIKDAQGTIFAPSFLITDLLAWAWGESLLVQVTTPFTLSVTGATIDPTSPIELEAGWNWIPYLLDEPASVQAALGSLGSALELVEDGLGRSYPASPGNPLLETLTPGRGYKVRLSEPRTFSYASTTEGPSWDVATIEEALALTDLEPGQQIIVRGFRAEGDGGAGELQVTTSGCVPDGGTCFVPTEHTEAGAPVSTASDVTLYGSSIQWESFRLCHSSAGAPTDPSVASGDGCYDALQMHGHGGDNGGDKLFDPAIGRVDVSSLMRSFAKVFDGDGDGQHAIEYRFSTSNLRLERVVEPITLESQTTTSYVRPDWWGALPGSGDATDAVAWALESAEAKAAASGTDHYVVLRGMFNYAGVIEAQEATVLKGEQDGVRDGQGLRVLQGAPWHYWAIRSETDPEFAEPLAERDGLGSPMVVIRHGRRSTTDRIMDVEIDGNLAENDYLFTPAYRTASGPSSAYEGNSMLDELLQNTTQWNGFSTTSDSRQLIPGSNSILTNVHVHDFGGNILLSNHAAHLGGSSNLKLGNTVRNHTMYGIPTAEGTSIDGIEIYGFFWKAPIEQYQGHYRNVVFKDITMNPYVPYSYDVLGFLEHRNDAPDPSVFYTNDTRKHYFGEDVLIEGVVFDLRNAEENLLPSRDLIGYARGPKTVRDVTVLLGNPGDTGRSVPLVNSRAINPTPTSSFTLEGAEVVGGGVSQINTSYAGDVRVTGIRVPDETGGDGWGAVYQVRTQESDGVFVFEGQGRHRARRPLGIWMDKPGAGADVFLSNADFINVDYPLVVDDFSIEAAARYRVFWRNVSFDRWRYNSSAIRDLQFLEGVTNSSNGRTSEDEGTLTAAPLSGGSGGRYVDVTTNLLWEPLDASYVNVGGPSASRFTGWSNVGTEGAPVLRLSFSGTNPVTVDWTAAVRPFPSDVVVPD